MIWKVERGEQIVTEKKTFLSAVYLFNHAFLYLFWFFEVFDAFHATKSA